MTTQPEALRLAAELTRYLGCGGTASRAAAELHRLAKVEDEWAALSQNQGKLESQIDRLVAQRDALRAELKEATEAINDPAVNNLCTLAESIRMLSNQRDALLEACKVALGIVGFGKEHDQIAAAIKAVEGKKT